MIKKALKKKIFRPKMPKICWKNRFLGIFSRFHHQFFLIFAPRCVLAILKTWLSPIFEKIFFWPKIPEVCRNSPFCRFSLDFFLLCRCFSLKNIINNNAHHQAWFNCHYNFFSTRNFTKIAGTADFRRKNDNFLNFWSCTLYFFMKFCTQTQNGNV